MRKNEEPTPNPSLKGGEQDLRVPKTFGVPEGASRAFTPLPSGRGAGGVGLRWWLLAGVCSALGVLAKYPMVMFPV